MAEPSQSRAAAPDDQAAAAAYPDIGTFDEVEAQLLSSHRSLRGLLTLLHGCNDEPGNTIRTRDICALLEPIADQLSQAAFTFSFLQVEERSAQERRELAPMQ